VIEGEPEEEEKEPTPYSQPSFLYCKNKVLFDLLTHVNSLCFKQSEQYGC